MNVHLNIRFAVLKGLNLNNLVRSAGERMPRQTGALKGPNIPVLIFIPFRAAAIAHFFPCVSRTVIQIQPLAGQSKHKLFLLMFGSKTAEELVALVIPNTIQPYLHEDRIQ